MKLEFKKSYTGLYEFRIEVEIHQWLFHSDDMENWCGETFGGHPNGYDNPRWRRSYKTFYFKNEKDATFFMLRWS